MASNLPRFYHPELDALRLFAFLAVFVTHAIPHDSGTLPNMGALAPLLVAVAKAGAFGVDLFFVLSAYLITALLLREHEQRGSIDVKAFYIRRALRIWPLYYTFLLFVVVLGDRLGHTPLSPDAIAAYALFGANWWYVAYGVPFSVASILWSVSVEEQFYLLLPLAFKALRPHRLAVLAISMIVVSNVARVLLVAVDATVPAIWMNTVARLDPIAAGMLIAVLGASAWRAHTRLFIGLAAPLVILLTAAVTERNGPSSLIAYPVITSACALLVLACLQSGLRVPRVLVLGGRMSYGLYVFHMFALGLVVFLAPFMLRPPLALLITVLLAAGSYFWFERPFLRLKERFTYVASRPS